jgi:hypothetical protein
MSYSPIALDHRVHDLSTLHTTSRGELKVARAAEQIHAEVTHQKTAAPGAAEGHVRSICFTPQFRFWCVPTRGHIDLRRSLFNVCHMYVLCITPFAQCVNGCYAYLFDKHWTPYYNYLTNEYT